jgi:hypothetical protein
MDRETKKCVDPEKMGPSWMLGEVGDLACQAGEGTDSWHQTVEEVRRSQDAGSHRGRAHHNIKPPLCTEYVLYMYYVQ